MPPVVPAHERVGEPAEEGSPLLHPLEEEVRYDAGGVGSAGSVGLSDDGRRGLEVAEDNGCESCHQVGGGGIGPDWEGRYGSTVTLDDDSTVTVDDEYLITAIVDPSAQIADGYDVRMPSRNLSDADVASIVAYIRELNPGAADTADTADNAVP